MFSCPAANRPVEHVRDNRLMRYGRPVPNCRSETTFLFRTYGLTFAPRTNGLLTAKDITAENLEIRDIAETHDILPLVRHQCEAYLCAPVNKAMPEIHISRMNDAHHSAREAHMKVRETEARRTIRYEIAARTIFWWNDHNGAARHGQGITRDLSTRGAFVIAPECPPAGSLIEVRINISNSTANKSSADLHAKGIVLRVERPGGDRSKEGFSVQIQRILPAGITDAVAERGPQ